MCVSVYLFEVVLMKSSLIFVLTQIFEKKEDEIIMHAFLFMLSLFILFQTFIVHRFSFSFSLNNENGTLKNKRTIKIMKTKEELNGEMQENVCVFFAFSDERFNMSALSSKGLVLS